MISRQSFSALARSPWRLASIARSNKPSSADCAMRSLLRRLFGRREPVAEFGQGAFRHQWFFLAAITARDRAGGQRREETEIHIHRLKTNGIRTAGNMRQERAERRGRRRRGECIA